MPRLFRGRNAVVGALSLVLLLLGGSLPGSAASAQMATTTPTPTATATATLSAASPSPTATATATATVSASPTGIAPATPTGRALPPFLPQPQHGPPAQSANASTVPASPNEVVYGQTSFTTNSPGTTASTFDGPNDVALDSSGNVYVADLSNDRVLEFPGSCPTTGCSATKVFGQTSFTTNSQGDTASTLSGPSGVALDSTGAVYVADYNNNRVLAFPSNCASTGCSATRVYGQTSFTSFAAGTTASTLYGPSSVTVTSSNNVYVLDRGNNRVLGRMPPGASVLPTGSHVWADFDGDGKTDVSLFRPSSGLWYALLSSGGTQSQPNMGSSGDIPVTADFDGDGKADLIYWNASTGQWFGTLSGGGLLNCFLGQSGDIPLPGDYSGSGTAGPAIFRPSSGLWYGLNSSCTTVTLNIQNLGQSGDIPIPRDYDGDGKLDVALYRPSTGLWYALLSGGGTLTEPNFGSSTDLPEPADYDGDGKADLTYWNPSTGQWYGLLSGGGAMNVYLGQSGDVPVPANYNATTASGPAIFRASSGLWYGVNGPNGNIVTLDITGLGQSGDVPLPELPQ